MSDSKGKAGASDAPERGSFTETDTGETVMTFGDGASPIANGAVVLTWAGFLVGLVAYMALYYFPDLAEWRAW